MKKILLFFESIFTDKKNLIQLFIWEINQNKNQLTNSLFFIFKPLICLVSNLIKKELSWLRFSPYMASIWEKTITK
jgi:hypothetical protein